LDSSDIRHWRCSWVDFITANLSGAPHPAIAELLQNRHLFATFHIHLSGREESKGNAMKPATRPSFKPAASNRHSRISPTSVVYLMHIRSQRRVTRIILPPNPGIDPRLCDYSKIPAGDPTTSEHLQARLLAGAMRSHPQRRFRKPLQDSLRSAVALAESTGYPLLVMPELFRELAMTAMVLTDYHSRGQTAFLQPG
jgi:hypothetical protein